MAEEEELLMEVEAVQAVYGDDCVVLDSYPPHLHLHIKPRTADVSSQQFVEALVSIRAGSKYPDEPPHIDLIESKGLDQQRQQQLISRIQDKACELCSCFMLVALCEELVERLTAMNHPDGNCPLCLYPLFPKDEHDEIFPFMKLMSCFHCFHSECIIHWWNWLQKERENNASSGETVHPIRDMINQRDLSGAVEGNMGNCPVCRKVFHAKDLEHVLDLVGSQSAQLWKMIRRHLEVTDIVCNGNMQMELCLCGRSDTTEDDDEKFLRSDSENLRRHKFEAILKLQQERSGIIEPKRDLVVLPGMFLPQPAALPTPASTLETIEEEQMELSKQEQIELPDPAETNHGGFSNSNRPSSSKHWNSGMRKLRVRNPRKQVSQWIRKDDSATD